MGIVCFNCRYCGISVNDWEVVPDPSFSKPAEGEETETPKGFYYYIKCPVCHNITHFWRDEPFEWDKE